MNCQFANTCNALCFYLFLSTIYLYHYLYASFFIAPEIIYLASSHHIPFSKYLSLFNVNNGMYLSLLLIRMHANSYSLVIIGFRIHPSHPLYIICMYVHLCRPHAFSNLLCLSCTNVNIQGREYSIPFMHLSHLQSCVARTGYLRFICFYMFISLAPKFISLLNIDVYVC